FTHPVELSERDQFSRSKYGNYQLKVSGNSFEIGYKTGFLTDSLFKHQEKLFFDQVKEMTGTPKKQKFLLSFLKWYNRDLIHHIPDRKSTRLNSSHVKISYAVFCLKKK